MRILVVEDENLIAMMVCDALADAGHDVIGPARTATHGLQLAQLSPPDVALLNIDLGGPTKGTELAQTLRSLFGTPVLFVSGNRDEAWAARDAAWGYISKPCKPSTLVKSVELVGALAAGAALDQRHIPEGLTLFHTSPQASI